MIEAYGKDGGPRAYHVARACTLAPDAVADASLPGRLAEKELQGVCPRILVIDRARGPGIPGTADIKKRCPSSSRASRPTLSRVVRWSTGSGWPLPISAVGKTEDARRWLDKAKTWLDQFGDGMPSNAEAEFALHFHNWLEAHVLLREAEALMGRATLEGGDDFRAAGTPSK